MNIHIWSFHGLPSPRNVVQATQVSEPIWQNNILGGVGSEAVHVAPQEFQ